jgi:hypothetical protein
VKYLLSYGQTPQERFETNMNDEARRLIQAYGLVIHGESGGTDLTTGVADQSFTVEGAHATALAATEALKTTLKREIDMEAC